VIKVAKITFPSTVMLDSTAKENNCRIYPAMARSFSWTVKLTMIMRIPATGNKEVNLCFQKHDIERSPRDESEKDTRRPMNQALRCPDRSP